MDEEKTTNMASQSSVATESETIFSFDDALFAFEDAEFPDDDSIGFSGIVPVEIFEQSSQSIVSLEFHESFISVGSPTQPKNAKVNGMEFHDSFISIGSPTQPKNAKVNGMDSLYPVFCDLESEEGEETSQLQALSERSSVSKTSKARTAGNRNRHQGEEARKSRSRTKQRSHSDRKSTSSRAGSSSSSNRRQRSSRKSRSKDATCPSTRRLRETSSQHGLDLSRSSTSSSVKSIEERSKHRENYRRSRREQSLQRDPERASLRSFVTEVETRITEVQGSPQPERPILARGRSLRAIPTCSILSSQLLNSISYHTTTITETSKEFSSDFLKPAADSHVDVWSTEKEARPLKNKSSTSSTHKKSGMTPLLKNVAKSTGKLVRNSLYTGTSSSTERLLRNSARSCVYGDTDDHSVASSACQSFAL